MCEVLVGLPDADVIGLDARAHVLEIHLECRRTQTGCPSCGSVAIATESSTLPTLRESIGDSSEDERYLETPVRSEESDNRSAQPDGALKRDLRLRHCPLCLLRMYACETSEGAGRLKG